MRRIRRPSPSMVVACLALGVALSGTAIAASVALPRNSVGTAQLRANAVATAKIRNNAVTTAKLRNNSVTTTKVRNGSLLAVDFAAGQLPEGTPGPAGAAGPAGPAGPSDAYARFLNGPIAVPGASTTLANLSIPQAGKYVIWGKAYFTIAAGSATVTCRLEAGADFDQSVTYVASQTFTLAMNVVHDYAAAGSVDFKCATSAGSPQANFIKITAIRVGNLTNSG